MSAESTAASPRRSHRLLRGWGRTAPTAADVIGMLDVEQIRRAVHDSPRGVLGRGLGRSYGDGAQNAGGVIVDGTTAVGIIEFDPDAGRVTAKAGTSLDQLMEWLVPMGWFVPVTPGTRQVTVGGAIAADIHGKNHHQAGSWCNHVESFRLLVGSGEVLDVHSDRNPDLFWATAGGMGLTGVVLDATFRCKAIETSRLVVDTDRAADLDAVMALMVEGDADVRLLGRVDRHHDAGRGDGPVGARSGALCTARRAARQDRGRSAGSCRTRSPRFPPIAPSGLINGRSRSRRSTNCGSARPRPGAATPSCRSRSSSIRSTWWRTGTGCTGRRASCNGSTWCPIAPARWCDRPSNSSALPVVPSFLAVLKRMGPGNAGHLSFPSAGWTLAFDAPVGNPELGPLLDRLDEQVVEAGGRIYLAKDSRVRREHIPAMYPRLDDWREIRAKADPDGRFRSDLGRRLGLI
jgi:decaprenylphospho-beta-D-ribofuranose 2-oxidase